MKRYPLNKIIACLVLAVLTLIVFFQVRTHDFTVMDDFGFIVENSHIKEGLSLKSLSWAFTTIYPDYWHPMPWLSHMLDYELFGLNPGAYHLNSLLLHIINTILLYLTLMRMTKAYWKSAFVAGLFALHPLHVESVAWLTARKDLLSTLFLIMTIWAYTYYSERPGIGRYLLVFVCFVLGIMSKPMLVTLPFVLLLLDYWPLCRLNHGTSKCSYQIQAPEQNPVFAKSAATRLILEKLPLFAVTIISVLLISLSRQSEIVFISTQSRPMMLRVSNALVSYAAYIGKTLYPHHLAIFYPFRSILPAWQVTGALFLLVIISTLTVRFYFRYPYLIVGWLWFLGTFLPVIGLVQWGTWPSMADRFTYMPLIGLFIMAAWGFADLLARLHHGRIILAFSSVFLIFTLMACTWIQTGYWKNSLMLFKHAIDVTTDNYLAYHNFANILTRQGKYDEAIPYYMKVIKIGLSPPYPDVYNDLGVALGRQGRLEEAIASFSEALRIRPDFAAAHYNMGFLLSQKGDLREAASHYKKALQINPGYKEALHNLKAITARMERSLDAPS